VLQPSCFSQLPLAVQLFLQVPVWHVVNLCCIFHCICKPKSEGVCFGLQEPHTELVFVSAEPRNGCSFFSHFLTFWLAFSFVDSYLNFSSFTVLSLLTFFLRSFFLRFHYTSLHSLLFLFQTFLFTLSSLDSSLSLLFSLSPSSLLLHFSLLLSSLFFLIFSFSFSSLLFLLPFYIFSLITLYSLCNCFKPCD
jgi:hypothetical protein